MPSDESSENYKWTDKFIKNISVILVDRGLTQSDLANAAGVTDQTVSDWMTGRAQPKFVNVWKTANALDESIDHLVGRRPPGSDVLERYRMELLARAQELDQTRTDVLAIAEALKQILPVKPADSDEAPGGVHEQETTRNAPGKRTKKGKRPKPSKKASKKKPPIA